MSTSNGSVKANTLIERINFDGSLGSGGKSMFGTLTSGTETTEGTGVGERSVKGVNNEV